MKARRAFTLVELIIALVLSTFVLVGLIGVTSQMLRYEFESSRKSTSTNWSLMALDQMKRELQQGSVLHIPASPTGTISLVLSGCSNWTKNTTLGYASCNASGCPTDGVAANAKSFYYCVKTAGTPSGTPWLLHYCQGPGCPAAFSSCPYPPPGSCGAGTFDVVAQDFYPDSGNAWYFKRNDDIAGVEMQFMVGIGTASVAGQPNAQVATAQHIKVKLSMQKSYLNTLD